MALSSNVFLHLSVPHGVEFVHAGALHMTESQLRNANELLNQRIELASSSSASNSRSNSLTSAHDRDVMSGLRTELETRKQQVAALRESLVLMEGDRDELADSVKTLQGQVQVLKVELKQAHEKNAVLVRPCAFMCVFVCLHV